MTTSVYWIHHPDHTDMFSQGYIGVSVNARKRWIDHRRHQENRHFANAVKLYGWDLLVKKEILIAEEAYCLDIERKLRPTDGIGWNLVMGGGKPPPSYGHKRLFGNKLNVGRKHSVESRQKRTELNKVRLQDPVAREKFAKLQLGQVPWNKGVPNSQEALEKMRLRHKADAWTCPHCNKTGLNKGSGNRWHFDNCKEI